MQQKSRAPTVWLPFNFKVDRLQNADVQTVAVDANSRKEICGKMKLGDFNRGRTARLCVTHGGSGDLRILMRQL